MHIELSHLICLSPCEFTLHITHLPDKAVYAFPASANQDAGSSTVRTRSSSFKASAPRQGDFLFADGIVERVWTVTSLVLHLDFGVLAYYTTTIYGASDRAWTCDPRITGTVLYQLSYKSIGSSDRTRTCDISINSRMFYQLNYRGIICCLFDKKSGHPHFVIALGAVRFL